VVGNEYQRTVISQLHKKCLKRGFVNFPLTLRSSTKSIIFSLLNMQKVLARIFILKSRNSKSYNDTPRTWHTRGYYYTIGFSLPSISEFMDLLDQEWVEMFDLEFEDVS
jgi:hypothetical protein